MVDAAELEFGIGIDGLDHFGKLLPDSVSESNIRFRCVQRPATLGAEENRDGQSARTIADCAGTADSGGDRCCGASSRRAQGVSGDQDRTNMTRTPSSGTPGVTREFVGLDSPTARRAGSGGHPCQGLYHRGVGRKPKVAMIAVHYQVDFSEHYLA